MVSCFEIYRKLCAFNFLRSTWRALENGAGAFLEGSGAVGLFWDTPVVVPWCVLWNSKYYLEWKQFAPQCLLQMFCSEDGVKKLGLKAASFWWQCTSQQSRPSVLFLAAHNMTLVPSPEWSSGSPVLPWLPPRCHYGMTMD